MINLLSIIALVSSLTFMQPTTAQVEAPQTFGVSGMFVLPSNDNRLEVAAIIVNSPADKAGIETGDTVVSVEGQSTVDMKVDKFVDVASVKDHNLAQPGDILHITLSRGVDIKSYSLVRDDVHNFTEAITSAVSMSSIEILYFLI